MAWCHGDSTAICFPHTTGVTSVPVTAANSLGSLLRLVCPGSRAPHPNPSRDYVSQVPITFSSLLNRFFGDSCSLTTLYRMKSACFLYRRIFGDKVYDASRLPNDPHRIVSLPLSGITRGSPSSSSVCLYLMHGNSIAQSVAHSQHAFPARITTGTMRLTPFSYLHPGIRFRECSV
ncbi:hypothetical protein PAXRUDRAFT_829803 [Paxillus rubicundulus Ve08.2h10]|uniref:Uncharacterized protein n=1 Tax=Paxillus rubicundulus Ve08.2h10 TaxID=930991 RepID=A0A0D0E574_9AGAM|nr:hypothetical protein PAXRUDRAFT_829803 [Paxillus rubicundulus Ve08.2h10]